jgi:hypothetical protein
MSVVHFFLYKFYDFHRFLNVLCSDSFGKLKLGKISKSFDKTSQIYTYCCYLVLIATNNIFVCNIHKLHPVCTTVFATNKIFVRKTRMAHSCPWDTYTEYWNWLKFQEKQSEISQSFIFRGILHGNWNWLKFHIKGDWDIYVHILSMGCIHGLLELVKIPRKNTKISLSLAFPWSNPRKNGIG